MYLVGESQYVVWRACDSAATEFTDLNAFFADFNLAV
jgi:hypothetical protein